MQLKSLRVYCDVVGQRSFSRAADENGISQSGASQIVHHLEERLGVKLLDRSKRPFVLTDAGKLYYDGCRELIDQFDSLVEQVQTLDTQAKRRVRVASIYSIGLSFMKEFVQDFSVRNPLATVKLEYAHPDQVYRLVESGEVDLGLISYPRSSKQVAALPWREEPMVLVTAPDHPLNKSSSARIEDLKGSDMVCFTRELRIRQEIDRVLADRGASVQAAFEFDNIETLKKAIEIHSGASILPAATVQQEVDSGALSIVELDGLELRRPVGIIHRRGVELSSAVKDFLQALQAVGDVSDDAAARNGADQVPVKKSRTA